MYIIRVYSFVNFHRETVDVLAAAGISCSGHSGPVEKDGGISSPPGKRCPPRRTRSSVGHISSGPRYLFTPFLLLLRITIFSLRIRKVPMFYYFKSDSSAQLITTSGHLEITTPDKIYTFSDFYTNFESIWITD